jgi:hypothetical protein
MQFKAYCHLSFKSLDGQGNSPEEPQQSSSGFELTKADGPDIHNTVHETRRELLPNILPQDKIGSNCQSWHVYYYMT